MLGPKSFTGLVGSPRSVTKLLTFLSLPIATLVPNAVKAQFREPGGPDYNHYGCLYNGKVLKDGPPQSQTFTGSVVCMNGNFPRLKLTLKSGKRHGLLEAFSPAGRKTLQLNYADGELSGNQKSWDEEGKTLLSDENFKKGQRHGVSRIFYPSNGKLDTVKYINDAGHTTTEIRFTEGGRLMDIECGQESAMPEDNAWCGRNGKASRIKIISDRGELDMEMGFLNSKREGDWTKYDNGKKQSMTRYRDGEIVAIHKSGNEESGPLETEFAGDDRTEREFFPESRTLKRQASYKGERLITEVLYFQNGKIRREWKRTNDDAIENEYSDRGIKTATTSLRFNPKEREFSMHGQSTRVDDQGRIYLQQNFDMGQCSGEQIFRKYDKQRVVKALCEKGKVVKKSIFDIKDKLIGSEEYFPDGSVKSSKGKMEIE